MAKVAPGFWWHPTNARLFINIGDSCGVECIHEFVNCITYSYLPDKPIWVLFNRWGTFSISETIETPEIPVSHLCKSCTEDLNKRISELGDAFKHFRRPI